MIDVFGPTGAEGMYTGSLKLVMSILRSNRDTLLSVLEPFVKDPVIDWKRYRSQQERVTDTGAIRNGQKADREMKKSMIIIDERLRGIYNLRNPNLAKFRRFDGDHNENNNTIVELRQQQEEAEISYRLPLSVDGQVHKLVEEATTSMNLVQLYVGWMPWL
jgi:serine/threonine-protein kinase ATR